jgi:hypothetical protein
MPKDISFSAPTPLLEPDGGPWDWFGRSIGLTCLNSANSMPEGDPLPLKFNEACMPNPEDIEREYVLLNRGFMAGS